MPGLRTSQGGSSMTWLTIVTSQCWRHRSELKMQNLETPLRAGCLGFFCRSQPRLFFNMWGFRLILYYNLLIRAFMRNWLTHAEVSARGIQIHPYSQVWSTHFFKGCFAEHHSILSFSCFQPSQPQLIFRACLPLMPSPGMFRTPAITPACGVTESSGFSFWVSPNRRGVLRFSSSEWVVGVLVLSFKVQYQLSSFSLHCLQLLRGQSNWIIPPSQKDPVLAHRTHSHL